MSRPDLFLHGSGVPVDIELIYLHQPLKTSEGYMKPGTILKFYGIRGLYQIDEIYPEMNRVTFIELPWHRELVVRFRAWLYVKLKKIQNILYNRKV